LPAIPAFGFGENAVSARRILIAVSVASLVALPAFAMGGGGGGYGGGMGSMGGSSDDYGTAKRMIAHQQYALAIPHLEIALKRKPKDADIANYLGFAHRKVGETMSGDDQAKQFSDSLTFYRYALQIDPNHRGVHEYLGELYLDMHDAAAANQELNTLASLCPTGCDERDTLTQAIAKVGPATP
jgi:predicted Zn-dependent protease